MNTFILYDDSLPNADSTRVLLEGIELSRFKQNPVMLYMHHRGHLDKNRPSGSEVIGRWENLRIEGTQLLADAVFDEEDELGKKIASKVKRGFLKGASIGIDVADTSEDTQYKLSDQKGTTITKSTLLEVSIVDIPQNEKALANMCHLYKTLSYPLATEQTKNSNILDKVKEILSIASHTPNDTLLQKVCEYRDLKEWKTTFLQTQSEKLLNAAASKGYIEKDEYTTYKTLFEKDFEQAQQSLEAHIKSKKSENVGSSLHQFLKDIQATVPRTSYASAQVPLSEEGTSVYANLLKHEPKKLKAIQQQDPTTFQQLLEAHLAWKTHPSKR